MTKPQPTRVEDKTNTIDWPKRSYFLICQCVRNIDWKNIYENQENNFSNRQTTAKQKGVRVLGKVLDQQGSKIDFVTHGDF